MRLADFRKKAHELILNIGDDRSVPVISSSNLTLENVVSEQRSGKVMLRNNASKGRRLTRVSASILFKLVGRRKTLNRYGISTAFELGRIVR